MSPPVELLAKEPRDPAHPRGEERLRGHTAMVLAAARELLAACGPASLQAARLAVAPERLGRIVQLAAFIHDLGKCSDHFQDMVRRRRQAPQLIRHEVLSLWLCWPGQPLAGWLRPAVDSDDDYLLSLLAAAGHHRKFWSESFAPQDSGAGTRITLLVSPASADLRATLLLGEKELSLAAPPPLEADIVLSTRGAAHPRHALSDWRDEAELRLPPGSAQARLLAVCKALLLDSDVAGSALPRSGEQLRWIRGRLAERATREELHALVRRRLRGGPLRPFQAQVAASAAPVTLLRAGCGSGKTAAAYLWAAEQHPGRQLFITYPTTGTATEGFRDYLFGVEGVIARLEHSRAAIDDRLFGFRQGDEGDPARERDRLDALRAWGAGVIACTVDTVLGLVQNQRKGLYSWAGLSHGAVVFDELHAYDDRLFGCLLRFLEALPGLPALLMTASLPAPRLGALRALAERVHGQPLLEIDGPADLERLPRYRAAPPADPLGLLDAALGRGDKVLWVCNTVAACLAAADAAAARGHRPLLYHSRFCYRDRLERHRDVIDAFADDRPGPALAVTTQVCEMSLDLSADLLLTQLAPVPALIQRLGRLNRRASPEAPRQSCPFAVLPPTTHLPYTEEALAEARAWLEALGPGPLSQQDLIEAWRPPAAPVSEVGSAWLDGRFLTTPDVCRDGSVGITVLLPEHAARVRRGEAQAAEWALPMDPPPGGAAWLRWDRVRHYPVPPEGLIRYDPKRGATWAR